MDIPKPEPTELTRPFWDALRAGHLVFQRCECAHAFLPARRHCPVCLRPDPKWERASGQGRLVSWVVYHTAYHPAFESRLPYNVALVELAEGPRLLTSVVGPLEALVADARVELRIAWEGDTALARFGLAGAASVLSSPGKP